MLCEYESPVAIFPFKGGESIIDVLDFAESSLRVS